jgi:hypothetical protein
LTLPACPKPPTAMQSPGFQHDNEAIPEGTFAPVSPVTGRSGPQLPLVSVTRNASGTGSPPPAGTAGRISAAEQLFGSVGSAHESVVTLA